MRNNNKLLSVSHRHVSTSQLLEKTLWRHIVDTRFTAASELQAKNYFFWGGVIFIIISFNIYSLQIAALEEAHKVHPTDRWWIKADGCDIVSGLEESLRMDWNGDVDLGTGELQSMYEQYRDRLKRLDMLGPNLQETLCALLKEKVDLTEDIKYIAHGKAC